MNDLSEKTGKTSEAEYKNKGFFADKVEKLRQKDFTCPFCREVVKGISALGRHLKEHCT